MKCPFCKAEFTPHNRSNSQNAYYWGVVLAIIEDETGHSVDEIHQFFRSKFLPNHKLLFGLAVNSPKSTSELSTMEFETYLSKIIMFASQELQLIIPNPEEKQ